MRLIELTSEINGEKAQRVFSKDHILIGRAESNDWVLRDGRVSSLHGQIVLREDAFYYQDLQSTNGSLVQRGKERFVVDGVNFKEMALRDGDALMLGDIHEPTTLKVRVFEGEADGETPTIEGKTILASRAISDFSLLSQQILDDKSMVRALFRFQKEIQEPDRAQDIYQHAALFLLNHVPNAEYVALHREDPLKPGGWKQVYFTTKAKDIAAELSGGDELFDEVVRQMRAHLIDSLRLAGVRTALKAAQPLTSMILAPLVHQDKVIGFIEIGNTTNSTKLDDADLDLVSVVSYALSARVLNLKLLEVIRDAEEKLKTENLYLKTVIDTAQGAGQIVGDGPAMQSVRRQIETVGPSELTVMILGETGTGKELVARAIHDCSRRGGQIFAAVNCGTFSDTLLESELFGHLKGSFTGAVKDKKGLFEVADGGSLFLDEIGETPFQLQVKLLRALQEGEIMPVGATRPRKVNVRVICATNKDLAAEVAAGRFREDLFYRLNTFPIHLPPMRERRDDVALLARSFLRHFQREMNKYGNDYSDACLEQLKRCDWPGNVRQLKNEVQRALLLAEPNEKIELRHFSPQLASRNRIDDGSPIAIEGRALKDVMEDYEVKVIRQALEENGWNRSRTAEKLGISRQAFMAKLSKYRLSPED
ncbi:MAG: FHA domain-containing protein [Myxococcales bacterium]|nr:MAG: FHA domain-containing protein [Myxococcales bacterium]